MKSGLMNRIEIPKRRIPFEDCKLAIWLNAALLTVLSMRAGILPFPARL